MRKYNITCIIPARKNSKGLINKNIKKINGKELIIYPFEIAQKSKYIKNIIFTSDSKKYINIINKYIFNKKKNFFFIHRPSNLSKDKTPTSTVIIHSLQSCFPETTHIVLLEPTSPLTQTKDVDKAIQILIKESKKADSIISVISNFKFSSSYNIKISRNNLCTFKKEIKNRRQEIKKNFYLSGNFYISKKESFFQYKSFYTRKTLAYEVPRNCYTDIDDKTDLVIARSLYDEFILKKKMNFKKQLEKFIPGGAHTYSRGVDQFPNNSPQILSRGKGCYVYKNKKKFLDFGMGLRSVGIGYAENAIDQKVIKAIKNGNNLTLPTFLELKAAKTIVNHFENIDMVKFARHGSTAVTSAIKIARSYNGKNYILRCVDHPFFSLDDWFIGSTKMARGVPDYIKKFTINFKYSDVEHLKNIINKNKDISCLIMEASTIKCPLEECCGEYPCEKSFKKNYIKDIQNICRENKIIFILDEMITGFRWDLKGAQKLYQVTPDISTFGKAIANGYSLSFVGGKRRYMEIGSINKKHKERSFILSTTHGSEAVGLSAMLSTLNFYKKYDVVKKNKIFGNELKKLFNKISNENDLIDKISMKGLPCSPYISFPMKGNKQDMLLKTFFMQEMLNKNILIPWISICYRHGNKELDMIANALVDVFKTIKKTKNIKKKVEGHILKSVFRKYN